MKPYIKQIIDKRNQLSEKKRCVFSKKICEILENSDELKNAKNVLIFYPYLSEVNVLPIASKAISLGKNVYFPKVTGETTMDFILVKDINAFSSGYKGIKEPMGNELFEKHCISEKTIMILPGSVFDFSGNRCGYGKGYYDRYLEKCYENITKIGVCFYIQMLKKIPDVKITDIPMDYVINERNTMVRRDE